ncbi:mucin-6-like [Pyxicephalus adspersus]|uniref:mucin-6-like n=1 Tax=Pyxicephalus adspersus TaxID=30357 RepID=UPI003B5BB034
MVPFSGFLLALIGVAFILIHAGPVAYPKCPPNREFRECGSSCPATCTHPDPPLVCNRKCAAGCFCKESYLPADSWICVREKICRSCTGNRTYTGCGSVCPTTCSNMKQTQACPSHCVSGCFCKPGFVFLDGVSICVLPKDCPPGETSLTG